MRKTTVYESHNKVITIKPTLADLEDGSNELAYITISAGKGEVNINEALISELGDMLFEVYGDYGLSKHNPE